MQTLHLSPDRPLRIGTRGSPLAMAQAEETVARLKTAHKFPDEAFKIEVIKTTGDAVLDRPLSEIGGKGLFTKEIEEALLDGRIDMAVHSTKDMAVEQPAGLVLDCFLPREDTRDAFVSFDWAGLAQIPQGATLGSSSLRRRAQMLHRRPDLQLVEFRGNVQTRLKKLKDGVAGGTFLAMAGLTRLGMLDQVPHVPLEVDDMLPAVAQGAIGIQRRADDIPIKALLEPLHHADTGHQLAAERTFLAGLDGSCQTPIGGLAELDGSGGLRLRGEIIRPDGSECLTHDVSGPLEDAEEMGRAAAAALKAQAGAGFFA